MREVRDATPHQLCLLRLLLHDVLVDEMAQLLARHGRAPDLVSQIDIDVDVAMIDQHRLRLGGRLALRDNFTGAGVREPVDTITSHLHGLAASLHPPTVL